MKNLQNPTQDQEAMILAMLNNILNIDTILEMDVIFEKSYLLELDNVNLNGHPDLLVAAISSGNIILVNMLVFVHHMDVRPVNIYMARDNKEILDVLLKFI